MLFAYFLTLAAFAAAGFASGGRVWGIAAWRHVPREVAVSLLILGALVPFALERLSPRRPASESARAPRVGDGVFVALVTCVAVALFIALRARAHYLGDGWQSLALLAAERPFVKSNALLTGFLLRTLRDAFGGGERGALLAFQALSVTAGALFLGAIATLSPALLPSGADRRHLLLLLMAGGWSLLFFGYVENYALFVAVVTAYALAGARAAREGGKGTWLAALLALFAIGLHGAGIVLVPSFVVLVLLRTRVSARVARFPRIAKVGLALGTIAGLALALRVLVGDDLSRQLLFVPLAASRFTVEGYTLFSANHLVDVANLLLVLVPGAAPLAVALARAPKESLARDSALRFLAVLSMSTALAVFLLDPKLGMPRDWDLFAFAGIPWALAGFVVLASEHGAGAASARRAIALATALGFLSLIPRALTNAGEEPAYRTFRDHLTLDHAKGRAARIHALNHWRRLGQDELVEQETEAWDRDFPERLLVREAADARARGDVEEALRLNREAIARAPTYSDPWNNLGSIDLASGHVDAAREEFEIARALNPNEPAIWMNLGTACFAADDLEGAARWWLRAWERTPDGSLVNKSLARLAQRRGDEAAYESYLGRAAAAPEAPGGLLVEWGDHLVAKGRTDQALAIYGEALRRGLTDEARRTLLGDHPELSEVDDRLVPANPTE